MDQETLHGDESEYRIYEQIAQGGFGGVFIGRDIATNVPVAVKRLHAHLKDEPGFVERFEQEASTVRGLTHPNIVRLIDQGRDQRGVPFIVMEWVEGLTIGDWLKRRGRYMPTDAAQVTCQVLDGLDAAWARRIVHRDIKPANLMVAPNGRVKIMDFGVAKDLELATLAGSSGLIGTPAYMAPEQLRGQPLDCRADLYAVGVTLFMMLTGRPPFEGPSFMDYFRQHLEQEPPRVDQLTPDVPPAMAAIVSKSLAKQPDDRYSTPAEMLAALRPFSLGSAFEGTPPPQPLPDATVISQRTGPPGLTHTPSTSSTGGGVVHHQVQMPTVATRPSTRPEPMSVPPSAPSAGYGAEPAPVGGATVAVRPSTPSAGGAAEAAPGLLGQPWIKVAVPAVGLILVAAIVLLVVTRPSATTTSSGGPTPTVEPATPGAGGAILTDALDSLANGKLPRASTEPTVYSVAYTPDGYAITTIRLDSPRVISVPVPVSNPPADSVLAVDAKLVKAGTNQYVVLGCRDQGNGSGYRVSLSPATSQVSLARVDNNSPTALAPPADVPGLNAGDAFNRMQLSCVGTTISASINGNQVASVQDPLYPRGGMQVGLGADAGGTLTAEAHFKNLSVSRP